MPPGDGLLPAARVGRTPDRSVRKYRKTYVVSGSRPINGVKPGGLVELDLTEGQEEDLLEAGHIAVPPAKPVEAPKAAPKGGNESS